MLVFEETGAIVAAPTFSLPEHVGGGRNWSVPRDDLGRWLTSRDYRFTWVRDTSFTLYALLRLGFTEEYVQATSCNCATNVQGKCICRLYPRKTEGQGTSTPPTPCHFANQ